MLRFAEETYYPQLLVTFFEQCVAVEHVGVGVVEEFEFSFIHVVVDGKFVEHRYQIHPALVIRRLLLPANHKAENTRKSEVIVGFDVLIVDGRHTVDGADDFFHINVIPRRHYELRNAVEKEFIPMLEDKSKFKIVDPEELLSPLSGNMAYDELLKYLKERYWGSVK